MSLTTWVSGSDYSRSSITHPALPISFVTWVKPHVTPSNAYHVIALAKAALGEYLSIIINTSRKAFARHFADSVSSDTPATTNALTIDTWNLVVAVFGGASSRKIYLNQDAALSDTATRTWTASAGNRVWMAGLNEGSTIGGGDGSCKISRCAIYTSALSDSDVASLYTTLPTSVQPGSLVSYYALDTAPPDDTGSNNWDLTVTGSNAAGDTDNPVLGSGSSSSDILYGGSSRGILDGVMRGTAVTDEYVQRRRSRVFVPRHYGER